MFATHQLLNYTNSDGARGRGHREWLTDPAPAQIGRIIAGQYYATAWTLRTIATGEEVHVMGPLRTHANTRKVR